MILKERNPVTVNSTIILEPQALIRQTSFLFLGLLFADSSKQATSHLVHLVESGPPTRIKASEVSPTMEFED